MNSLTEDFRDAFGPDSAFDGCDFKQHWGGWLYNAGCTIATAPTKTEHIALVWSRAQAMAAWITSRKKQFNDLDRFQLVVAWPISVRKTARQIIKIGGDFIAINLIVNATDYLDYEKKSGHAFFRNGWDTGIF